MRRPAIKSLTRAALVCLVLALVVPLHAVAGGPTDIAAFRERQRKAKDPASRADLTIDFALAVSKQAKEDLNLAIYKGVKEWLADSAKDLKQLQTKQGKDDPEAKRLLAKLNDAITTIQADIDYVKAHQLDGVTMPADSYAGADREKIKSAVLQAWAERSPKDKVLAVLLPKPEWERKRTEERVGSEWKKYDISSMVVKVIVDKDDERATIHTIIVQVNHHQNESLQVGQKGAGFDPVDIAKKNLKH